MLNFCERVKDKQEKKVLFRWFFFIFSSCHRSNIYLSNNTTQEKMAKSRYINLKTYTLYFIHIKQKFVFFIFYFSFKDQLCPMKMFSKRENFTFLSTFVNRCIQQKTPFLQQQQRKKAALSWWCFLFCAYKSCELLKIENTLHPNNDIWFDFNFILCD